MKNVTNWLLSRPFTMTCFVMALVLVVSCNQDDEEMTDSIVDIVASFESEVSESNFLTYNFINNTLVDGSNTGAFTSSWGFGGDGTSMDENPSHTFSNPGTYEVTLTVTASDGEMDTVSNSIIVELSASTIIAGFIANQEFNQDLTFSFTNTSVVNGISDTLFTSFWEFGNEGTSKEQSPTHTFSAAGFYDISLTVTAADGEVESVTETIEVKAITNKYASITDSKDDDTGELRLSVDSIQIGRLNFIYRLVEGQEMNILDAFINVAGTATTGDMSITEIRILDNAPHQFREGASQHAMDSANFPEGVTNEWVPVEISWNANGSTPPLFSVIIGGQTVITDAISTTNGGPGDVDDHLAAVLHGARNFQWKYNSNFFTSDASYHIDNIVVYSSDSGTEIVVFEDSFEGWQVGENLNPWFNVNSPYHENTVDATVGGDY